MGQVPGLGEIFFVFSSVELCRMAILEGHFVYHSRSFFNEQLHSHDFCKNAGVPFTQMLIMNIKKIQEYVNNGYDPSFGNTGAKLVHQGGVQKDIRFVKIFTHICIFLFSVSTLILLHLSLVLINNNRLIIEIYRCLKVVYSV